MSDSIVDTPNQTITISDCVSLEYKIYGSNDAPIKIIFIMGLICPKEYWFYQIEHFKTNKDIQFVIFNNRGVGESTKPRLFSLMSDYAYDTKLLLDKLGWSKVHMIGISMGGMISLQFAAKYPKYLNGLVLINTHAGGFNSLPFYAIPSILKYSVWPTASKFADLIYGHKDEVPPQKIKDVLLDKYKKVDNITTLSQIYAILTHYISYNNLVEIKNNVTNILILASTRDLLVDYSNSVQMTHILGCEMITFENKGHSIVAEDVTEVNKCLDKFIKLNSQSDIKRPRVN